MQTNYTGIFIHVDLHTYIHQVHPYIHTTAISDQGTSQGMSSLVGKCGVLWPKVPGKKGK